MGNRVYEWILNKNNIIDIGDENTFEVISIALQEVFVDEVSKNIWTTTTTTKQRARIQS